MKNLVNQTILYVGLSQRWGTDEKSLVRDVLIASNLGYQVLVVCIQGSFLDLRLRALNIPTVHDKTSKISWPWRPFAFYMELKKILTQNTVSLIHTYDFFSLWPLGSLLKRRHFIPLVYTRSKEIKSVFRGIIHQIFLSRIDLVITPAKGLKDSIVSSLPLKTQKVQVSGLGLKFHQELFDQHHSLKVGLLKKYNVPLSSECLGTYVEVDLKILDSLIPILVAVQFIVQNHANLSDKKNIVLFIFCERNWSGHPIFKELTQKVEDFELSAHVVFHTVDELEQDVSSMDAWIGHQDSEYIRCQDVFALFHGVHLLLPRSGGFYEVLLDHRWGNSYKEGDSRDLRFHLEEAIKKKEKFYLQDFEEGKSFLKMHSWEEHQIYLEQSYLKLMSRRYRLFSGRQRFKRFLKNMSS